MKNWKQGEFYKLASISVPAIFASLGHLIYGLIDNLMVGRLLGAEFLTSTALASGVYNLFLPLGIGAISVFASVISSCNAGNDIKEVRETFKYTLIISFLIGFVLTFLLYASSPLIKLFAESDTVFERSKEYLQILSFAFLFSMIFVAFEKSSEGLSDTRISMCVIFLCNILNAFLNYSLILGKFGMPKLGLNGAAISTLITTIFECFFIIIFFFFFKKLKVVFKEFFTFKFDFTKFCRLLRLTIPSGFHIFFENSMFYICVFFAGLVSEVTIVSYQIILLITSIPFVIMYGFMSGITVRVAHHFSLKNYNMIKTIIINSSIFISILMLLCLTICYIFRVELPSLFVGNSIFDKEVVKVVAGAIMVFAFFEIFDAMQILLSAILRGLQDTFVPSLISFLCFWVLSIPLAFIFGVSLKGGVIGMWIALGIGMIVAFIAFALRLKRRLYVLNNF